MRPRPTGRYPSSERVRRRSDFQLIQTLGKRVRTRHFVLALHASLPSARQDSSVKCPPGSEPEGAPLESGRARAVTADARVGSAGPPRLGITATRRVGNAAVRNRAKRLVREAFRATRDLWPDGIDLVVIVRWMEPSVNLAMVEREWRGAARAIEAQTRAALRSAGESAPTHGDAGRHPSRRGS